MNFFDRLKTYRARFRVSGSKRKRVALRKIFYLPRVSTKQEMRLLVLLGAIVIVTGITLVSHLYVRMTIPIPTVGGLYTEGMLGDPHTINPIYVSRDTDRDISRLIFSGLLAYNENGVIQPDLAEKFEISPDGKTYTVTLKKDIVWHDGEPITVDDVIFTIHTIQNSQFRSPLRSDWQGVSVEKVDDSTIRFSLRAPYGPFVENLTVGIIPQHVWQNVSPEQAPLHEANLRPVGSGPYQFDQLKQNKDGSISWYQIIRNDHYHRSGPYIQKIVFQFFKTEDDMFSAWRRGLIDGYGGVSPLHTTEINPEKSLLLSVSMPRVFGIFFNPKRASALEDINIRQAITYAVNRNEIAQNQRQNKAIPAEGPLPWLGVANATPIYSHDPDKARALLKKSGWKDSNGDGILDKVEKKKVGNKTMTVTLPLRFTLITSDWPDLLQTAAILQRQLKEVGIDLVIEKKSYQELESTVIRPRNFDMLLFGQVYGYEADPFAFWHSSQVKDPGLNITFFSDKKVDALLEDIRKTSDTRIRNSDYRQFSDIIIKSLPAVFLFSQDYLYILPTDIQGVSPAKISLPSDRFNEINTWYRAMTRTFTWGK